ncbi:MAG: hypothetical protein ABH954_05275 [Candidatus Omnitrophota bacterium]
MRKHCIVYLILFLFISVCTIALAEEGEKVPDQEKSHPFVQFVENIFKKIEFVTGLTTAYDSNIFLSEDNESSDLITILTQNISLELPEDPYYFELDYTGILSYYMEEGDNIHSHTANFLFSYRPFDNLSFGLGNYFKKMHTRTISTVFGDRLLSRGYKEDSPVFEIKYEPTEKTMIDVAARYYWIDAVSPDDDYIDRDQLTGNIAVNYDIWSDLTGFIGYRAQDAHFPNLSSKDAMGHRGFAGFTKKFDTFNIRAEVGQEHKDTFFQGNDANTDFRIGIDSTFSTFTMLNLNLTFNEVSPSARKEYFQYFTNAIDIGFWRLLNPKTSISTNVSYRIQDFDSSDVLSGNAAEDRKTDIISASTFLTRNLNDWLKLNLGYAFTKRNTDFAQEGYTDNRISFGLIASY